MRYNLTQRGRKLLNTGKLIKLRRKELNMTQEELAVAAGTTKAAISHYELGRREPRFAQLQAIAKVLGLSLQELSGEPEEPRITIEYTPGQAAVPDEEDWTEEEYFKEKLQGRPKAQIPKEQDMYFKEIASHWAKLNKKGKREAVKRIKELSELPEYQAPPEHDLSESKDALRACGVPFGNNGD